jgi:predicted Fe-S protein YdhL (DUF1289 family)
VSALPKPALPDYDPFHDSGAVPSPCVNVCRMNQQSGFCEGCYRTIDEIIQWSQANDSIKRAIWVDVLQRRDGTSGGSGPV